jgi:hypothetical protein
MHYPSRFCKNRIYQKRRKSQDTWTGGRVNAGIGVLKPQTTGREMKEGIKTTDKRGWPRMGEGEVCNN